VQADFVGVKTLVDRPAKLLAARLHDLAGIKSAGRVEELPFGRDRYEARSKPFHKLLEQTHGKILSELGT
jgi:hypothetical protein